ncbi:hypothetical protein LWI29_011471 [Acer saccharum]|uniref:Uncharacterized protein n=1 Tax=Acer saccharum TaxID=4024 RepID=A0AA39VQY9_ACESA|nr:hypothetical protein LWI29_011471 [Acer saccharum]
METKQVPHKVLPDPVLPPQDLGQSAFILRTPLDDPIAAHLSIHSTGLEGDPRFQSPSIQSTPAGDPRGQSPSIQSTPWHGQQNTLQTQSDGRAGRTVVSGHG